MMFERYTEQARRVLFLARYEASQLGGQSIETEHVLLGLVRDRKGLANRILSRPDLSLEAIRSEVEGRSSVSESVEGSVEIPFSAAAKRVLVFAAEEADRLLHGYIGAEHLLLGILRDEQSVAASILEKKGMRLTAVREHVIQLSKERERGRAATHIVLVLLTVNAEMREEFERVLMHNARESVRVDPGCLRFDVSQHTDDPNRWVLYEVYESPEAHALHRQSPHFLAYDEVASRAVVEKTVMRCRGKNVG